MKEFLRSNKFHAFLWCTFNGLVALIVTHLSGIGYEYMPLIIAALNLVTKELNKNFNPNYK